MKITVCPLVYCVPSLLVIVWCTQSVSHPTNLFFDFHDNWCSPQQDSMLVYSPCQVATPSPCMHWPLIKSHLHILWRKWLVMHLVVVPSRFGAPYNVRIDSNFTSCHTIFINYDAVHKPLWKPYNGHCRFAKCTNNIIDTTGQQEIVSH